MTELIGTPKLSTRAASQVAQKELERHRHEAAIKVIDRQILGIVDNDRRHGDEDDEAMTRRLRQYKVREGKAEVRFFVTGDRRKKRVKDPAKARMLKAFEFIFDKWKKCRRAFEGVELSVEDIAAHIGAGKRRTQYILSDLENGVRYESKYGGSRTSPGLIVRRQMPGAESYFAVTLPESREYLRVLADALAGSIAAGEEAESEVNAEEVRLEDQLLAALDPCTSRDSSCAEDPCSLAA